MASGSSGRANSGGSKGFDFGSDDILCSYEDYPNAQDSSNGTRSDTLITSSSAKDYHKSRMARTFPASSYSQPEDSFSQDMVSIIENSMKKQTDNVMRFLEGISSRLSQLELYCYNLDKSIGEMRADLVRDHGESDLKLKSVEKHLQEVHRSVQILRDKQELADTQKELAKLQLVQKESSSSNHSQSGEEKATTPVSDPKTTDSSSDVHNQQLALALPHQVMPQQQPPSVPPPSQAPPQNVVQQPYYLPPAQLPTPSVQTQQPQHPQQGQYLPPDSQYRTPQVQEVSRVAPHPQQPQVSRTPQGQQYPQYQQQWSQQLPQQVQQSALQPQGRPSSTTVYPPYPPPPGQATNPSQPDSLPNSMPMQVSFSPVPQPLSSRVDTVPYGYGAGRPVPQQPPPQQIKSPYGAQSADGYAAAAGTHSTLPPGSTYMIYDGEGGRSHIPPQQPHFAQGGYPPQQPHLSLQSSQPAAGPNMLPHNPSHSHFTRNHPYSELIEKLVSMGFRGDHVVSIIQRMEETGQPVDFNAVLDRLNVGPQRGWSG